MLDYEKVDKMVENCKKLYPDVPDYCLWVLACDYYLKEGKEEEEEEETINRKKEALEAYEKAKKELENTKYETIKVV
jgi:transposase